MAQLARAAALALAVSLGPLGCGYPEIVAGYAAKMMCSCVFVAGRDEASCLDEELGAYERFVNVEVEREARAVRARGLLVASARADHDERLGCTLR